jgi:hypothetical protein
MSNKAQIDGLIAQLIHAGADKAYIDGLVAQLIHAGSSKAYVDGLVAQLIHAGNSNAYVDGLIVQLVHDGENSAFPYPRFRDIINNETTYDGITTAALTATRTASGQPSTFREALKNLGRVSSGQTNDLPFSLSDRIGNYDS